VDKSVKNRKKLISHPLSKWIPPRYLFPKKKWGWTYGYKYYQPGW